jgi:stage IV sporulation protein FA
MKDRRKEIQNRIAKRRKMTERKSGAAWTQLKNEDQYGFETNAYEGKFSEKDHPLFRKEYFYFKILGALCLFLFIAVIFKHPSAKLDDVRSFVTDTMEQEFQFASISTWYEDKFGKPIAFLPDQTKVDNTEDPKSKQYAMPVSGKITDSFDRDGQGIILETGAESMVDAMKEGIVIFAGSKKNLGKTVVIQHNDKSESWYGQLQSIDVKLYQFVNKGNKIGKVTTSEDGAKGTFYLAIKKDDKFIDPKKVISFE